MAMTHCIPSGYKKENNYKQKNYTISPSLFPKEQKYESQFQYLSNTDCPDHNASTQQNVVLGRREWRFKFAFYK